MTNWKQIRNTIRIMDKFGVFYHQPNLKRTGIYRLLYCLKKYGSVGLHIANNYEPIYKKFTCKDFETLKLLRNMKNSFIVSSKKINNYKREDILFTPPEEANLSKEDILEIKQYYKKNK